jgi:hypothetical protein
MNNVFNFNYTLDTFSIKVYQELSQSEKKEFLTSLATNSKASLSHCTRYKDEDKNLTVAAFFITELLNHQIKDLKESLFFNKCLKSFLFYAHPKKRKNFECKKPIIDSLIKQNLLDINELLLDENILNVSAIYNDLKTIKYLISYGAKTDYVDTYGGSFASLALSEANFSVFNFAINQPDFDPLKGSNTLYQALIKNHKKAIESIIYCTNPILSNHEYIKNAKAILGNVGLVSELDQIITHYEKYLLDKNIPEVIQSKTKIKI